MYINRFSSAVLCWDRWGMDSSKKPRLQNAMSCNFSISRLIFALPQVTKPCHLQFTVCYLRALAAARNYAGSFSLKSRCYFVLDCCTLLELQPFNEGLSRSVRFSSQPVWSCSVSCEQTAFSELWANQKIKKLLPCDVLLAKNSSSHVGGTLWAGPFFCAHEAVMP